MAPEWESKKKKRRIKKITHYCSTTGGGGGEKFVFVERMRMRTRKRWGKGKEVSGLGHVSCTLESSSSEGLGCGTDWMS